MKCGFLWRTNQLSRLLRTKCKLALGKLTFTATLWAAKQNGNLNEEFIAKRMIDLIDQSQALTNYGISKIVHKSVGVDWIAMYNLEDARLAAEIAKVVLEIKKFNSNKEGA